MAALPNTASSPSFPLLWDTLPGCEFDLEDHSNLTLNVGGKGVYLPGLDGGAVTSSHRLDLPFPLRSVISSADFRPSADGSPPPPDGAALPLLAGDLGKDGYRDPVAADVSEYRRLRSVAESALSGQRRLFRTQLTRSSRPSYMNINKEGVSDIVKQLEGTTDHLPNAARQLQNVMPLVQLLTRKPVFRGWDADHNWTYGGGTIAVMNRSQKLLHTCGRDVAVAELWPRGAGEDGSSQCGDDPPRRPAASSSRLTLRAEDEALLTWPDDRKVLQIEAADARQEMAVVRSLFAAGLYLHTRRRLTRVDYRRSLSPLSGVCCAPELPQRWVQLDTAGRFIVRDCVAGADVVTVQVPEVERQTGWFGVDPTHHRQQFRVACWERLYSVDVRLQQPAVLFRLSDNSRLFIPGDRLHAVRTSALRPHLTLLTSSRHLVVVDSRRPQTPWLRSRLTVPPAPVYLSCCPAAGGGDTELVAVAGQADQHVQALVFDWAAGAELGASRLLGCPRPPVEAAGAPGMEAARRLTLPLAGVAVDRPSPGRNHLYTTNSCGDVFVHPLVASEPAGDGSGERRRDETGASAEAEETERSPSKRAEQVDRDTRAAQRRERREARARRRRRKHCSRLVSTWKDTVEEQRHQRARSTALLCDRVAMWTSDLRDLLGPPPREPAAACGAAPRWRPPGADGPPAPAPEQTPQRVRSWLSRARTAGGEGPDGSPGPGEDQTDRTPGPEEDRTDRTPGPEDQTDRTPARPTDRGASLSAAVQGSDSEDDSPPPPGQVTDGSSTDVSTPPHSEIEELLMQWETDGDASETPGALSVAEELTASALSIPGSQRRRSVPRWQCRRRLSSGSSHVSSAGPASRASSRASSRGASAGRSAAASAAESGTESSVSGAGPASSMITPARPLPAVSQASAFQQFSLDLFDD